MEPSVIYEFDPRKLPDEILAAIGLIATCSAQNESVVEAGISACLDIDFEFGAAITTHMNAPQRDNVLRAVAEIKMDNLDDLDELDRLLDQINAASAKRNTYVHRGWCQHPTNRKVYTVKTSARGRVETDLVAMDLKEIRTDAQFIYQAGMDLQTFLIERDLFPKTPPEFRNRFHKSKAERKKRRTAKQSSKSGGG
jgi:hypothetical protein